MKPTPRARQSLAVVLLAMLAPLAAFPAPLFCSDPAGPSTSPTPSASPAWDVAALNGKILQAEEFIWSRFYSPETNLFYDYLTSFEQGRGLDHLPRPDEIDNLVPNTCGYGTGMEDCMISAGVMMAAVLARLEVDGDRDLAAERAARIFDGIERCVESLPGEGFVARGMSPFAPGKFYIGTSRDQVTHAEVGMWNYYRSELPDEPTRERIRNCARHVADRMVRNAVPENGYDFLRADGARCQYGICTMDGKMPHEAARLAMVYAIAWDVTGDPAYRDLWRKIVSESARKSLNPAPDTAPWGLLQMEESLRVLDTLEPDPEIKATLRAAAGQAGVVSAGHFPHLRGNLGRKDLDAVAPDWREVGGLVDPYRSAWYFPRECGEMSLAILNAPGRQYTEEDFDFLCAVVDRIDFSHSSTCGIFDLVAAWWKARKALCR